MAFILLAAYLSVGAVAKKEDPIVDTQTDPIDYREKQKEEKEGKKGPPVPSINLFPKYRFLTEDAIDKTDLASQPPENPDTEFWLEDESEQPREEDDEFKPELETDDTWRDSPSLKKGVS